MVDPKLQRGERPDRCTACGDVTRASVVFDELIVQDTRDSECCGFYDSWDVVLCEACLVKSMALVRRLELPRAQALLAVAEEIKGRAERIGAEYSDESSTVSRALEIVASCIEEAAQKARQEAA